MGKTWKIHRKHRKKFSAALRERCIVCGKKLPYNNKHHFKCEKCWEKENQKK